MKEKLENIIKNYLDHEGNIVSLLQDIQDEFGYIPEDAVDYVSKKVGVPVSKFYGVATFYSQFYLKPRGKNIFTICRGTACHVKGSAKLLERLQSELSVTAEKTTTEDGLFTVEKVACVGACSMAPVAVVNHKVNGKATINLLLKKISDIKKEAHQSGKTDRH